MKNQVLFFALFLLSSLGLGQQSLAYESSGLDAIYDLDDRQNIDETIERTMQRLSRGVALIVSKDHLSKNVFSSNIMAIPLKEQMSVCPDERFANELSINACTGFLVAPDLMISAGHCFKTMDDCLNKAIIFDVTTKSQKEKHYTAKNSDVFECREILASSEDGFADYALIRLNKKTNRPALPLRVKGMLSSKDEVFMIGHPLGQPMKISQKVKPFDLSNELQFKAPLDSFSGNSGSPVINARTLRVEGILVNGAQDFLLDETKECYRFSVHQSGDTMKGEGISRINQVTPFLSH